MEIIKIEKAKKVYKKQVVLNKISISFEAGKIHGLVGHNGAGKTVLLKAICGLIKLDSGKILVRDKLVGKDFDFPPGIGILIERPGFLPQYNAMRNLQMYASLNRKIDQEKIRETILKVGLDPDDKKHVGKYSMGMKQRLGIAQAIMENPDILLLDEPISALDRQGAGEIRNLLLELKKQGKTILIATHYDIDIRNLCDTVCELEHGNII